MRLVKRTGTARAAVPVSRKYFFAKAFQPGRGAFFQMNTGASTAMGHHGPGTGKRFVGPGCLCAAPFPHPGKSIAAQSRRHAYKQGNNFSCHIRSFHFSRRDE